MSAIGEEGVLPASVVADLLGKVAPYERGHAKRIANGFVVAVAFLPESDASRLEKDLVVRALEDRLAGAQIVAVPDDSLSREGEIDLLVICDGVTLETAAREASRRGILSIALRTEHVASEHGAAMGLVPRGGKPKILVNLDAVKRAALDIDSRLLGLAELVQAPAKSAVAPTVAQP